MARMTRPGAISFVVGGLIILSSLPGAPAAANITYDVDRAIGAGSISGTITTDGTIGVLSTINIVDWELTLNDGTIQSNLLGPLSGANSNYIVTGKSLTATATDLLFNFGTASTDYVVFQILLGSGNNFYCAAGATRICGPPNGAEHVQVRQFPDLHKSVAHVGVVSIASAPIVPDDPPPEIPDHSTLQLGALQSTADKIYSKVDALGSMVDTISANLAELLESSKVHIEVVESSRLFAGDKSFLVLLTEYGEPVDAGVTHVFALSDLDQEATALEIDWDSVAIQTGLVQLDISLERSLRSARIFLIQVEHEHGGGVVHQGSSLVSLGTREAK